jgi:hypothetical protein
MKKLLLLVGITGVLGLVSVGTRADAAIVPDTQRSTAPSLSCQEECDITCVEELHCECAGCHEGVFTCSGDCHA